MAIRGPKARLWRWRRSPLKRRSDTVEAWVILGTWVLAVLAGLLAGLTATWSVGHQLARERVERRPAVARLTERAPGPPDTRPGAGSGERVWAEVRWPVAGGTSRTGQVRVRPGSARDTPVMVWTDRAGRLVTRPATASQARLRAETTGALVGVSAAALPMAGGRVLRGRLDRRRMERWDAEWARFAPLWGRRTS